MGFLDSARYAGILGLTILLTGSLLLGPLSDPAHAADARAARAGQSAPSFSLLDTSHQKHSLADWRGHPVAVFFYCGCAPCHRCALLWADAVQNTLVKRQQKSMTVVVFSGEAPEARAFAAQTYLDPARTVILLDSMERTAERYGVTACPRVFALDAAGIVRYTNDEPGSDPQETPPALLVSRTLTAMMRPPMLPKGKTPAKRAAAENQNPHEKPGNP